MINTDKTKLQERILSRIKITDNGCWEWTGAKRTKKAPYGCIGINNKVYLTHRVSYYAFVEDIPDGVYVCHKCDNPKCVNPSHLFLGTAKDNMQDCKNKGRLSPLFLHNESVRFQKGRVAHNRSISEELALQIKSLLAEGLMPDAISKKTGINRQTIADIKRGQAYQNV